MNNNDTEKKWNNRYLEREVESRQVSEVLEQNQHLLPIKGKALEIACGLGANALFLAQHGLQVEAWDISPVAIEKLDHYCAEHNITLQTAVKDLSTASIPDASYDVIVVSYFLDRTLIPSLIAALRPGGLLFYQTHTADRVDNTGPSNPDYLLQNNELLELFDGMKVLVYREEGTSGDTGKGFRNAAMLVGMK